LNNSIKYSSTRLVLIKILYDFKIKELLDLLRINNLNFNNLKVVNILITFTKIFKNIKSPSLRVYYGIIEIFRGDVFPTTVYRLKYINI
jgi:hypothetical protein